PAEEGPRRRPPHRRRDGPRRASHGLLSGESIRRVAGRKPAGRIFGTGRLQAAEGRKCPEEAARRHEDAGHAPRPGAARPGAVGPAEGFRARTPGGLTGKGRAGAGRRPRVPTRRRRVPQHEGPSVARVIVLTCEDDYGVRDNQAVLVNRSGKSLEEL